MPMYAYCLFCETQRCRTIAEYISKVYGYRCIYPRIIQRKWVRGASVEERHDWLPGYLFIYTEEKIIPRFDINGIVRCLGNRELAGTDLAFAEMIYRENGIIGIIPLIKDAGRCSIADPSWNEISGRVIKMDHERKRCCIEYEFDGQTRTIWTGYEITEKG